MNDAGTAVLRSRDDGDCLRSCLTGLMDQYERPLFNYLRVLLGEGEAALDCSQDTFLRAYENLARGKQVNSAWLYRVGRNLAMDVFRRRGKLPLEPLNEETSLVTDPSQTDADRQVRQTLARLTPADRELLYLAYVDRFRARDIAALLGIRENAVRMRLHRASRRFAVAHEDTL